MTTSPPETIVAAALAYAARGWPVLPLHSVRGRECTCKNRECGSKGKHPRTRHGLLDATTDEDVIRRWWTEWPDANIGVVTGPGSGLLMVGPDGAKGKADLAALEAEHGELPPTVTAATGSGGEHRLFRYPDDGKVPSRRNLHGTAIDVRGAGGYFVAAPSVNESGPYRWLIDPDETQIAIAPDWLVEWCRRPEQHANTNHGPGHPRRTDRPSEDKPPVERVVSALERVPGADDYDRWVEVGMSLHSWDDLAGFAPWCNWSSSSTKYSEAECRKKWASFKAGGGRTIATVFALAISDGWQPTADGGPRSSRQNSPGGCDGTFTCGPSVDRKQSTKAGATPTVVDFAVGELVVRPGTPRQTESGKIIVPLRLLRDGKTIDSFQLSNSGNGRKAGANIIRAHDGAGDRDAIERALREVLALAVEQLDRPARVGDTVRAIVAARVPDMLRLTYRTARGIYSEEESRDLTRADLLAFVPSELLTAAAGGCDAPEDDSGLLRAVKYALEVLWADLRRTLRPAVDLHEDTPARRAFEGAVIRMWTVTRTWEVSRVNDRNTAARVSLAGMVQRDAHEYLAGRRTPGKRESWRVVRQDVSAFWRPVVLDTGQCVVLVAMRYGLADQLGVTVPDVTDQESFTSMGVQYRLFADSPPVRDRLTDGTRLSVADAALSAKILATIADDPSGD